MVETLDCAVIGAGAVGLATAVALARRGREVVVLEAAEAFGTGISSRNSEVIHAGLYYPHGSLKARLCVAGRDRLYAHLAEHGVAHERCRKLVVACTDEERGPLAALAARALGNGVDDLQRLTAREARALEPEVACVEALLSPSTGIFDSHGYMLSLLGCLEAAGGMLAVHSPVIGGRVREDGIEVAVGDPSPITLLCRTVVNAAGLGAQAVAAALDGFPAPMIPRLHLAKGTYFSLAGRPPFRHLVYPVPGPATLGSHYTRDLAGQGRFGPDIEWVERQDYDVDPARAEGFYEEARLYWPRLPDNALQPGYTGIRPKIHGPGEPVPDYCIQGPGDHGIGGLAMLFGIESPGLTSSLAIGDYVADLLA